MLPPLLQPLIKKISVSNQLPLPKTNLLIDKNLYLPNRKRVSFRAFSTSPCYFQEQSGVTEHAIKDNSGVGVNIDTNTTGITFQEKNSAVEKSETLTSASENTNTVQHPNMDSNNLDNTIGKTITPTSDTVTNEDSKELVLDFLPDRPVPREAGQPRTPAFRR